MVTKVTRVKTKDCPDANGRQPLAGELKFTLKFPLEDGSYLFIEISEKELDGFRTMLKEHDSDYPTTAGEDAQR